MIKGSHLHEGPYTIEVSASESGLGNGTPVSLEKAEFVSNTISIDDAPSKVVTILHGIRDTGIWALQIKHELRQRGASLHVEVISYPHVGPLRFIFRILPHRANTVVKDHIDEVFRLYPQATHSLIAYSNGTKIVSDIMDSIQKFDTIIFCGSVCARNKMPRKGINARVIVNDFSPKDIWPLIANAINPFAYEATGTYGCRTPGIEDRAFNVSHDGWKEFDHFNNFIVPIIISNLLPLGETPTQKFHLLNIRSIRFVVIVMFVTFIYLIIIVI